MAFKFIILIVKVFFKLATRIEYQGLENIPEAKPVLITSNHVGFLDGFMILTIFANHPNLVVVIAEKYQKNALYRWAAKKLEWYFIDRYNPDIRTMRKVINRMKDNGLMVIAPEGTRSPNGQLIEGKQGAAYIAAKTNATIVPAGTTGSDDHLIKSRFRELKRLDIKIKFGKPYKLPPMPKHDRGAYLQHTTDEIMCQIAALLPYSYRGIYKNHPRLKELLGVQETRLERMN